MDDSRPASPPPRNRLGCLLRTVAIPVVLYLGVVVLFMALENWMIYFPARADKCWEPPLSPEWQDVYISLPTGGRIHGWWCPHPRHGESSDVVLYCHGNAGNLSARRGVIPILQSEWNASVFIFDYPGYGKSEGRPNEAACYASAEAAYRWLTEDRRIPGERVILYGVSLGGGVATYLAVNHRHRALVLAKTFTSLPEVGQRLYPILPVRWLMRTQFNNLERIPRCPRPIAIIHGTNDSLVPFSHAERLYAAAPEPKLLYPVPDGDHNSPLPIECFRDVRDFLRKHRISD